MAKYEDRLRRNANLRFGITAVIFLVALFVIGSNYNEFTNKKAELKQAENDIEKTESDLELSRENYRDLKKDYAYRAEVDQQAIAAALPEEAQQTLIVREIETYTNQLAGNNQTLVLSSVTFNKLIKEDNVDYAVLPMKISLVSNRESLMGFLRYLEHTGSITNGSENAGRLIDVQDIGIQVLDSEPGEEIKINADISANAYVLPTQTQNAVTNLNQKNN